MGEKFREHHIDMLFVVVVFLIFTFSAIAALLLGVNFYRDTTARSTQNEDARIAASYIREVVHQHDAAGITISNFDGCEALVITEENGTMTYLYLTDGSLTELYATADAVVSAGDGTPIMELKALSYQMVDGNAIQVNLTSAAGEDYEMIISIRSGGNI